MDEKKLETNVNKEISKQIKHCSWMKINHLKMKLCING